MMNGIAVGADVAGPYVAMVVISLETCVAAPGRGGAIIKCRAQTVASIRLSLN